ncbi:hypothetical protein L6164_026352 [Bauhinia variegata]|uniref:Uncharacterized protein n=1 Tax=Bauhinia variegata TaxID=167791 RepID=A0ACB9LPW3_BAUVA|nr:hypothetical protein L6164_026352 [Bauhinia variegata]
MDIAGAVANILGCLCTCNSLHECIADKCTLLWKPTRNLNKLGKLMEELEALQQDVKSKLEQMQPTKGTEVIKPTRVVTLWMTKVEKLQSTKGELMSLTRPIPGCCHFSSKIKLGERIDRMIKEINDLLEKGKFPNDSIAEILPNKGYILPATSFMKHETTVEALNRIMELLLDDSTRRIGVYGMGGVGKTTIMIQINNHLLKEGLYDCVMWISVSKELSLDKLQKNIATYVGLDLSTTDDEMARAAKLFEALSRRKRSVLILDDLWQPFSLEAVGIPTPTTENGCKLVITTRSLETCGRMETDEVVEVKVLPEDEAWSLFRSKATNRVLTSPDIESIAKEVVKECGGLPLAIVTVGGALRTAQDISEWERAFAELKESNATIGGMDEAVISRLSWSFHRLKDDTCRSCFLFCALYPEDHLIDTYELIDYWMFEGLLGVEGTATKQKKQKGQSILDVLRRACLLNIVTHKKANYVKLHDLTRDMAITVMTRAPPWHSIVKPFAGLAKQGHIEWADVKRVSLMRNDLKGIDVHSIAMCPTLTSLLLQYNSFSGKLPENMFDFMPALKLLDLSYTGISCLPKSLSNLENLRALLLSNCWYLTVVPSLEKLGALMALDLSCCRNIQELPHGTEKLINLKRLDISNTCIAILQSGLLSSLRFLEELLTGNSNVIWTSNSIDELISSSFSGLVSLEVDFCDSEDFNRFTRSGSTNHLLQFKLRIGQAEAQETFTRARSIVCRGQILEQIPQRTQELKLHMVEIWRPYPSGLSFLKIIDVDNCPKLESLFSVEILLCLDNIEEITVSHCGGMEELIKCGNDNEVKMPYLKGLTLMDLPKLKSIFDGIILCNRLESIEVISCDVLKRLPLSRQECSPTLKIKGTTNWWRSLEWDNEDIGKFMKKHFVSLFS